MNYQKDLFKRCFDFLLKNEGGYVDDPDDSGGETYKGISRNNWPVWDGWIIIDSYKANPGFPKTLNQDDDLDLLVEHFYLDNYWYKMNLDLIVNENVVLQLFDMGINAGKKKAIRIAQSICGVVTDGILGIKTAFEINHHGYNFVNMYIKARIKFYTDLAERKPKNKKYLNGWIHRAKNTKFDYIKRK